MNVLLDTCALIDLAYGQLPPAAREALKGAPCAYLSPVVPWEIAIKVKAGRLTLPDLPLAWVQALALRHQLLLPSAGLDAALLCAAADLPLLHRDPFDRILVATAQRDQLTLLTSDRIIATYPGINVLW